MGLNIGDKRMITKHNSDNLATLFKLKSFEINLGSLLFHGLFLFAFLPFPVIVVVSFFSSCFVLFYFVLFS